MSRQEKKVSIIIPCFNAERWIGEAVQSCIAQTFPPEEIIIVDNGSSDKSLEVVESFGDVVQCIRLEVPNAARARNVGFTASRGDIIQFLDADDLLLPEKLQHQVHHLDEGFDVVYGDWRHQHHDADGRIWLERVQVSGQPKDLTGALLRGWWVAQHSLLLRRGVVERIGGWDESLAAAQDRDFFIRLSMATTKIAYVGGCHTIYRRYGAFTVSTANNERWARSHFQVLQKVESEFFRASNRSVCHSRALAAGLFASARALFGFDAHLASAIEQRVRLIDPQFRPTERRLYNFIYKYFGFFFAEVAGTTRRQLDRMLKRAIRKIL